MKDKVEITMEDLPITKHAHETLGQDIPDGFYAVGNSVVERYKLEFEGEENQAITQIAKCRSKEWAEKIAWALNNTSGGEEA